MARETICSFCTMRMGKILNLEEVENWRHVPDKEFCQWKKGMICVNPRDDILIERIHHQAE